LSSGQIQVPASGILDLNSLSLGTIGLQNTISRIKTNTLTLQYDLDALTAQISGFVTNQDALTTLLPGQNRNLRSEGIMPSISSSFSPNFRAGADFSYRNETLQIGGDRVFEFRTTGNYLLTDRTDFFAEAAYVHRDSNAALSSVSSASGDSSTAFFRLGIRHQF
jgi:predicted porin